MAHLTCNEPVLNSSTEGIRLAECILNALNSANSVEVSFAAVERATPSFSNAFVMTLLESIGIERMRSSVRVTHAAPHINSALARSVRRYQDGIRLSTQRLPLAS